MNPTRRLLAGVAALAVLLGAAACQASRTDQPGSTVTTNNAEMPDLPKDPVAAEAAVRKLVMDQAIVLLKASGLKYTEAQFDVPSSFDADTQNGELLLDFAKCTPKDVQTMTSAISAHGWQQSGVSHGVSVAKGGLSLEWGKVYGGCSFVMTTVNISQRLHIPDDLRRVPELAAFKAKP